MSRSNGNIFVCDDTIVSPAAGGLLSDCTKAMQYSIAFSKIWLDTFGWNDRGI
jgi:hypothetical protein